MAEALYRKYRPQVFEDVVGQEPIERTLKNAISQDKVSHAYLFCGPRGTGKTTTARLLSKALLCEKGPTPDPDGTCEDCRLVAEGAHPDVYELDAASRTGVENVREEIISRVHFAPTRGRYKVYIIDEVHMLSTAAFNALLKTLEEPPSHVVFVLCTTDPQKVPETIHSRCQRFDFHRISPESMVARLGAICVAEGVEFQGEALDLIAQRAGGGLRDALTSLEQIIAFENGKVTLDGAERLLGSIDSNDLAEIMAFIGTRDIAGCFRWTAAFVETGADLAQFARDMAEHVRNLYLMALVGDDVELDVSETARQQLASELTWFGPDRAARLLGVLGDLMVELKTASNPRLVFEIYLTRMVRAESDLTLEALAERVEALERGTAGLSCGVGEVVSRTRVESPVEEFETPEAFRGDSQGARETVPVTEPALAGGAAVHVDDGEEGGLVADSPVSQDAVVDGEVSSRQKDALQSDEASPGDVDGAVDADAIAGGEKAQDAASKVAGLANPAGMQRTWQGVMADVKGRKAAHGVLFMNAKASFDEAAGAIRIVFPAEASFAFNAVQKSDVQESLASAIEKVVGQAVPFRLEQDGSTPATASAASVAASPAASFSPSVAEPVASASSADTMQPQQPQQQPQPESNVQSESQLQPESALKSESQPQVAAAPDPAFEAASMTEEVPYEAVPYDDVPYEEVPYGEFDVAATSTPAPTPAPASAAVSLNEQGAAEEDAAALQAMLQASFGAGVELKEMGE